MKKIKLTNSNKVALVDDNDFERVNRLKWYLSNYDGRIRGYKYIGKGKYKTPSLSSFILNKKSQNIRYVNKNNKLDNRRSNIIIINRTRAYWKDHGKKYKKIYYENNKEKIKEQTKVYCEKNKDKLKQYKKQYREKNKEKLSIVQKKYRKKNSEKLKLQKKEYRKKNKDKFKVIDKEYRENNKDKISLYHKNYRKENRDKLMKRAIKRTKERKLKDPLFKLRMNISSLIRIEFIKKKYSKNKKTQEIIGCTFEEFKLHIESKFESWMNWNNYGNWNGVPKDFNCSWDLDHVVPTSSAKTKKEVIKLNHYTNFQPLCSYVNRHIKKDKLDYCPVTSTNLLQNKPYTSV